MSSWSGSAPTRVTTSVLLCGYYGEHNLGDDALLAALLAQLPPSVTPLVTAFDQDQIARQHGVASVNRRSLRAVLDGLRRCRALVLGGGSLLQDSTSFRSLLYYAALITAARLQGKPVLLWAQGLGPLRRRRSRALVRLLLPLASGITWRDSASAQLSRQLGVAAPHGTDAVWSLPRQHWLGLGGPIVVCWRPTPHLQGQAWKPYLQALEDLAEQTQREVIWLPFHRDQDQPLFDQLQQQGLVGAALARRSRVAAATTRSAEPARAGQNPAVAHREHAAGGRDPCRRLRPGGGGAQPCRRSRRQPGECPELRPEGAGLRHGAWLQLHRSGGCFSRRSCLAGQLGGSL